MKTSHKKYLFIVSMLLLLFSSCTLNAEQEAVLSESTTRYLESKKNGAVLAFVSMHHPEVVRYYKTQGDSVFLKKFSIQPEDYYLSDPSIRESKKDGELIHVLYEAKIINNEWDSAEGAKREFIAISENDGKNWFYVDRSDYVDKSVASDMKRLLELKD
jgi:hypothetical protein